MKKLFQLLSVVSLCLLAWSVQAAANPDFWLARKDGQQIWLLGSIHVGTADFYPLPAKITLAWQNADTLVVETTTHPTPEQQQQMSAEMLLPSEQTLENQLPAPLYRRLATTAARYQLSPAQLTHFRPWVAAIFLQQQAIAKAGYQARYGLDEHFQQLATESGKNILYLESPAQQMGFMNQLHQLENKYLANTLDDIADIQHQLPQLISAWKRGDAKTIQAFLGYGKTDPDLQSFFKTTLLEQRNRHWIPQLKALKTKNNFVVVGAMHLYGQDGLIELLKSEGYQLSQQRK